MPAKPETALRKARVSALLTQEELARKARVHVATITRAEQGESLNPLTEERLARALGKERAEVFPWSEEATA